MPPLNRQKGGPIVTRRKAIKKAVVGRDPVFARGKRKHKKLEKAVHKSVQRVAEVGCEKREKEKKAIRHGLRNPARQKYKNGTRGLAGKTTTASNRGGGEKRNP